MFFNSVNWNSCMETVSYRLLLIWNYCLSRVSFPNCLSMNPLEMPDRGVSSAQNTPHVLYSCLPGSSRSSGQNIDEDVSEEVISGRWWRLLALASQGLPCIRFLISWLLTSIRASAERLNSFALCSCACEQFSGSDFSAPTVYQGQ